MYAEFYGFRTEPFHVTPDASLVFLTKGHREAIGVLEYGLRVRKGFVVITGEVGVGKTTVLRHSLRRLDADSTAVVYVLQPSLTPRQLFGMIWQELAEDPGDEPWAMDTSELIRHIYQLLLSLHEAGRNTIIVIDDAQNMPTDTLESLRLLSNLETDKQKLVQIVLAGQPELDDKLALHELRQLNQRIAVRTKIPSLNRSESLQYIRYRLQAASGRPNEPFTKGALDYIVHHAGGNPRRINIFCDNALINGMGYQAPVVTRKIAAEAIQPHLVPEWRATTRPESLNWPRIAFSVFGVVLLVVVIGAAAQMLAAYSPPPRPPQTQAAISPSSEPQPTMQAAPIAAPPVPADKSSAPPTQAARPPAATPSAARASAEIIWTVSAGETMESICQKAYGLCSKPMVRTIENANLNIADPKRLNPGQTVNLPVIENLRPMKP